MSSLSNEKLKAELGAAGWSGSLAAATGCLEAAGGALPAEAICPEKTEAEAGATERAPRLCCTIWSGVSAAAATPDGTEERCSMASSCCDCETAC